MYHLLKNETNSTNIVKSLQDVSNKKANNAVVHTPLSRLVRKGYLSVHWEASKPVRGGKRRKSYQLTKKGAQILSESLEIKFKFWQESKENINNQ
ncbi:PadR family transcriptional regulator [Fulvivirga sp.]|uniref:PadR family transcriptional regulator n=1 Tax=Fulvivirga sp. TaxID=1931237 RepID=UPI0032EE9B8B